MRMVGDSILVELDPESSQISGSVLYKPDDSHDHVYRTGKVLQAGPGKWAKKADVRVPVGVVEGDGVVFVKFVATFTKTAQAIQSVVGETRAILKPEDILLVYDRNERPEISQ